MRFSPFILAKTAPCLRGHGVRGKDDLLLHQQALGPAVSVGFAAPSLLDPPSSEAWDKGEAESERRASSIASCYFSDKKVSLVPGISTCTTGFNSALNCLFQSDDPASHASSDLFGGFYLECSYLINMLTNSRPYLIASKGGNLIMCTCSVS